MLKGGVSEEKLQEIGCIEDDRICCEIEERRGSNEGVYRSRVERRGRRDHENVGARTNECRSNDENGNFGAQKDRKGRIGGIRDAGSEKERISDNQFRLVKKIGSIVDQE